MKNWLKENWFRAGILITILAAVFSVGYYYVIFLPQKEQARINQQKQEQIEKELKEDAEKAEAKRQATLNSLLLEACLADAENKWRDWGQRLSQKANECKVQGGGICRTAEAFVEAFDKNDAQLQQDKDECFKKYPQQ